jgi:hypothetical protein
MRCFIIIATFLKWGSFEMDLIALKTSIVPDTSVDFTSTLVVAGFLGVLLLLIILIVVFSIFSKTVSKTQKFKGKKKVEKAIMTEDLKMVSPFADVSTPVVSAPAKANEVQQVISEEIVAAISAAVYMMEGENAVIRNITPMRKNPINTRNPWAMAAITQNTKPF